MWEDFNLINILKDGGVVVMPTDTIYGIVGRAEDRGTVERIYKVRKRNPERPCIILIGEVSELERFSIEITDNQKEGLKKYWSFDMAQDKPEPVSIILDCPNEKLEYLHRGTNTLAFRLPNIKELRDLLMKAGPLVAPSANPEGLLTASKIDQAKEYFGNDVDLYVDGGQIEGKPSKLIKLHKDGTVSILRE
jgi:L-threonylcarbamoyladenylate synthase